MIELKKSRVVFDEATHSYTLDGVRLNGITSRLGKSRFFKGKFDGIPKHILQKKAEFGSMVHKQIELYDSGEAYIPMTEVLSYAKIKEQHGITTLANEFLVSDDKEYATMIDLIDSRMDLIDHKTSYTLDKEYLSWQLSICGYLLKLQTGVQPNEYFVTHFQRDGSCLLLPIDKKTDEEVYDMLYTDKYMVDDVPSADDAVVVVERNDMMLLHDIETTIIEHEKAAKQAKDARDKLLAGIGAKMEEAGIDKVELESLIITRTKSYMRKSLDADKLFADHPALKGLYDRETEVKGGIKIKIK